MIVQARPREAPPQNIKRIMVVDDEVFNVATIKHMINTLDPRILQFVDSGFNGEDAVALIRQAINEDDPHRYALILTDISMPHMDGNMAAKRIRELRGPETEETGHLTIVAVTGHCETEFIKKAIEHGVDEVFPKPMTALSLGRLLKRLGLIEMIPEAIERGH